MLPLYDTVRSRRFPVMNWILIGLNVLIFLNTLRLTPHARETLVYQFGMLPDRLDWSQPVTLFTLITSTFLHGGWFHLLSNMWILYIFGDNVEDRMGPMRYLIYYLVGGIIAGLIQAFVFPNSNTPAIGASGAIAGVLGGYYLLYPRARVITLIPILIFPWILELPALIYLGIWFISQLFSGFLSLSMPSGVDVTNIAWWAHVGGFIYGLLFIRLFIRTPTPGYREYLNETRTQ